MIHLALLILLALATLVGVVAFLLPAQRLNPEHPFDTGADPWDDREHVGRHRHPDDQDTTRLDDRYLHPRN